MEEYSVAIDGEVENPGADGLSLTGTVNGTPCAAIARLSVVNASQHPKREKQKALIHAYLNRHQQPARPGAEKVSL